MDKKMVLWKDKFRFSKDNLSNLVLSTEELETAELEIIRLSQKNMFLDELASLKRGDGIKKSSHIYGLCPILEDVLRVGGRFSRASMPEESKHPVILANNSHIADILLQHIHQEVGGGRNHMLSKLRQKYWIPGVSSAIRKLLYKCIVCQEIEFTSRMSTDGGFTIRKSHSKWTSIYPCWGRLLMTFWGKKQKKCSEKVWSSFHLFGRTSSKHGGGILLGHRIFYKCTSSFHCKMRIGPESLIW